MSAAAAPDPARAGIAIVCGAGYVSGKEIMALTLARGLRRRGMRVHLICSTWNDGDFPRRLTEDAFEFTALPLGFISASMRWKNLAMTLEQVGKWPRLLAGYRRLRSALRPERTIHTNWHHALLLQPLLDPERDVLWFHEVIPDTPRYRFVFGSLARRLRHVIAVSGAVADGLERAGVPRGKILVVHNGLEAPAHPPPPRGGGPVTVGIVGQVGEWKGHEDLLDAFRMVAARNPDVRLVIFGRDTGEFASHLKRRIRDLGLGDRIDWAGYQTDRARIYERLDICAVPSRSADPLPTTAIEAGFFGLPVVATRRGGLPEIVDDGKTGLLVPVKDPAALAEAISRLAGDREAAAAMGARARARMTGEFSADRFVRRFAEILELEQPEGAETR